MQAVTFSGHFGFLHPAAGRLGVVLCGSIGYEQLCAHAGWRELADGLAQSGFPAVRFDLLSSGDSLDWDGEGPITEAWLQGLESAIDVLKQRSGVDRVALVGLRLGALLAAQAAARRRDVDALVLLAPPSSGKALLREWRALAAMMAASTRETKAGGGGLNLAGHHLPPAVVDAIGGLTLPKAPGCRSVLLLAPQGQQAPERIAGQWALPRVAMESQAFAGYADWMTSPTVSRPPRDEFAALGRWLGEVCAGREAATAAGHAESSLVPSAGSLLRSDTFCEEPLHFGPQDSLFGILCRPSRPAASGHPLVVFLNAGANSHLGWGRMTVEHARALADDGVTSLRMDLAGLGDSRPAPGRASPPLYEADATADVAAALDTLSARGFPQFVLSGLCSGAHAAFHAGCSDPRVVGIVMTNLQKFVWTPGDSLEIGAAVAGRTNRAYFQAALRPQTWLRLFKGEVAGATIAAAVTQRIARGIRKRLGEFAEAAMGSAEAADPVLRSFRTLAGRGGRALVVYSEDDAGYEEFTLHLGRGAARFTRLPGMRLAFIADADHNLTGRPARDALLELTREFLALPGQSAVHTGASPATSLSASALHVANPAGVPPCITSGSPSSASSPVSSPAGSPLRPIIPAASS